MKKLTDDNLERVKELYQNGFRCIKYEDDEDGRLAVYFKNFENEAIDMILSEDKYEIENIKSYINNI
ncbi:hypothetical protein [Brassicibacter mesophilus]|uniref:hypothetical protein n=1 Tax=Brassicibacter mesophilus TaxID=745119 RepID=UPI003D1C5D48